MTATTASTTITTVTTTSIADTAGAHGHPSVVITEKTKQILFLRYGYKIGRTLAVGGYGVVTANFFQSFYFSCLPPPQVFEASNTALRKPQVALKVINNSNLTSEEREVDLPKELTALMEVKHQYVVRVYDNFRHHEHVFIFMKLADGGDLAIYRWHHRPLREALVASWF